MPIILEKCGLLPFAAGVLYLAVLAACALHGVLHRPRRRRKAPRQLDAPVLAQVVAAFIFIQSFRIGRWMKSSWTGGLSDVLLGFMCVAAASGAAMTAWRFTENRYIAWVVASVAYIAASFRSIIDELFLLWVVLAFALGLLVMHVVVLLWPVERPRGQQREPS